MKRFFRIAVALSLFSPAALAQTPGAYVMQTPGGKLLRLKAVDCHTTAGPDDQGFGYQIEANTAAANDFSTVELIEDFCVNRNKAFDVNRFYNPANLPFGDLGYRQYYGAYNAWWSCTNTQSQERPNFVASMDGAGRITGLALNSGTADGYSANATAIEVILPQIYQGQFNNRVLIAWGFADASGTIIGWSKTKGATTNNAFPSDPVFDPNAPTPGAFVQGKNAGAGVNFDAGCGMTWFRDTGTHWPKAGSNITYHSLGAGKNDNGGNVVYGGIAINVISPDANDPRGEFQFITPRGARFYIAEGAQCTDGVSGNHLEDTGNGSINCMRYWMNGLGFIGTENGANSEIKLKSYYGAPFNLYDGAGQKVAGFDMANHRFDLGKGSIEIGCGTTAGSAKVLVRAGGAVATVLDNLGSGVSGC